MTIAANALHGTFRRCLEAFRDENNPQCISTWTTPGMARSALAICGVVG
jgi:hypothetical protein